jgi:hypothetical protein
MPWLGTNRFSEIDSIMREALNPELLPARDELCKQEVMKKIRLSPAEIASGISRYARQIRMRIVVAPTRSNALIVKRMIEEWIRHDALATEPIGSLARGEDTVNIRFDNDSLTIGEALEDLRYQAFLFRTLRHSEFLVEVNKMLKKIVEGGLLAREALKRRLENTLDIRNTLSLWADYWSAHELANAMEDTIRVDADETSSFMLENHPDLMKSNYVSIREIFSDSVQRMFQLAIRTSDGDSIEELVGENTERNTRKARDGKSSFFAIAEHLAIGPAELRADSDAVVGPLQV